MQHYFSHNSYCVPNVIAISWKMKVPQAYKPVTSHRNKTIIFQRWAQDLFSIALNYCNIKSFIVLLQSRTLVTLYCKTVFDVNYDNLIGNCIRFLSFSQTTTKNILNCILCGSILINYGLWHVIVMYVLKGNCHKCLI